jgi:soluble lytic murein transglycosylase-like protein
MPTFPTARSLAFLLALVLAAATLPAHADCIDDAAARHQVNADVLRAIGWQESGLRPAAVGHNGNGSVDVGAFQINTIHLPELARHGVALESLLDGCVCAEVAAWHYRRQIDQRGNSWQAVGAYHSRTAARAAWYANQIATILMRWNALPRGALPFPAERTLAAGRAPPPSHAVAAPVPLADPPSPLVTDPGTYREIAYLPSAR